MTINNGDYFNRYEMNYMNSYYSDNSATEIIIYLPNTLLCTMYQGLSNIVNVVECVLGTQYNDM